MDRIKEYVSNNNVPLFKTHNENPLLAFFDNKGFYFSESAELEYNQIKNQPHLYVANGNDSYYIGKSFQKGGRWKRSHYYHLGILAHEILNTCKPMDQRHGNWVDSWMQRDSFTSGILPHKIMLQQEIRISFIPFEFYSNQDYNTLAKAEIRKINTSIEKQLIQSYRDDEINLLNVQHS